MTGLPIKRWPWLMIAPRLFVVAPLLIAFLLGFSLVRRAWKLSHASSTAAPETTDANKEGSGGTGDFYRPTGYLDRVKWLIDDKKLRLDKKGRAEFAEKGLDTYDREFRELSAIEDDVKTLNEDLDARDKARADGIDALPDFRGTLAASRRNIRIRQYPSLVPLPFSSRIAAQTTTRISSANAWKLISDRGTFTLVPSEVPDFATESLWTPQSDVVARRVALYERVIKAGTTSGGRRLVELEYGLAGVVVKAKQPSILFYVDGKESAERTLTLKDGTVLGVTDQKQKLVFVCRSAAASIPTNATTGFGELSQTAPPPPGTPERIVWEFDRARQSRKPGALQETRFRATLDLDLNANIQRELEAFIIKKDKTTDPKLHYRPASVALLNPSTGDLLALATYPTNGTSVPPGMPFETKARRLKNQNLFTHPIGSCGKPFLAAAIYDCYPHLANMRLARIALGEGNEVNTTLGLKFAPSYDDTAAANFPWGNKQFLLGREEFFIKSVNTYFIDLFLLSLASDSEGTTRVTGDEVLEPNVRNVLVNGTNLARRPDFQGYIKRGEVFRLEQHPPVAKLAKEFDVEIRTPRKDDPGEVYDLAPFQDAVGYCSNPREALFRWGQSGLLPESVSLDFESMQYLRADLFSYLLGGGTGRWTNVKLAEAMARLITGRRVAARIICLEDPKGSTKSTPPAIGLSLDTIALMRQSLQGATSHKLGGGTAVRLAGMLEAWNETLKAQGLAVKCYSKTGTWHGEEKVSKGKKDLNSGTYVFYLSLVRLGGKGDESELAAVAGAIDIEDRGTSAVAVELAENIFALLRRSYFGGHGSPVSVTNTVSAPPRTTP